MDELTCELTQPESTITACVEHNKWIIRISKDGIKFNHEEYPNATADVFAQAFIDILEKQFDVTMEKRKASDG